MELLRTMPAIWDAESWREDAACTDVPTDLFFPIGQTGDAAAQIARAKAVCASCPVRAECLEFAVTTNQEYGIWAGLDEDERRMVRRRWRAEQRRQRQQQVRVSA